MHRNALVLDVNQIHEDATVVVAALSAPSSALAFHHTDLPATVCHAPAAGSPSNDNDQAKEALTATAL